MKPADAFKWNMVVVIMTMAFVGTFVFALRTERLEFGLLLGVLLGPWLWSIWKFYRAMLCPNCKTSMPHHAALYGLYCPWCGKRIR